jgi:hypothetical protein
MADHRAATNHHIALNLGELSYRLDSDPDYFLTIHPSQIQKTKHFT